MGKLWTGTWAGGRTREINGRTVYYLRRRVGDGVRVEVAVADDEDDARVELALFKRDPANYQTPRQKAAVSHRAAEIGEVRLDASTIEAFLEAADVKVAKGELTKEYRDQTLEPYLLQWARALRSRDLRKVQLEDLRAAMKTWKTAKHKRVVALKAFTAWAREEKDAPKLHRKDDPTIDLKTPPIIPAKMTRTKGYPLRLVERLYAELISQAARDVVCLRARLGLHDTEIARIASGEGVLRRLADPSGIEGTITFVHKKRGKKGGSVHIVSCDAQTLAAAERLQTRKKAVSRNAMKTMINRACKRMGLKWDPDREPSPIQPNEMRHSFATWATTVGEEVHPVNQKGVDLTKVAEHMGHLTKRTTAVFYVGDRVPMMIRLPLRLEHPEDPIPLASPGASRGEHQAKQ